jgi:Mg2+ and Co2+ transporter CorA
MRLRRFIAIVAAVLATGCADLKEIVNLAVAIQEQFKAPANVNIINGSHMMITFRNAPQAAKSDNTDRAAIAREVARFATTHYTKAAQLEDITIAFAEVSSNGAVTVTRTERPYTFPIRELK